MILFLELSSKVINWKFYYVIPSFRKTTNKLEKRLNKVPTRRNMLYSKYQSTSTGMVKYLHAVINKNHIIVKYISQYVLNLKFTLSFNKQFNRLW